MDNKTFNALLDELDGQSLQTLKEKNARYSNDWDALHNFKEGGEIAGTSPAHAAWGYMTKHLVALRDMVLRNDFSNREDFLEKCQDSINYIRFIWCIGNEEISESPFKIGDKLVDSSGQIWRCEDCNGEKRLTTVATPFGSDQTCINYCGNSKLEAKQ